MPLKHYPQLNIAYYYNLYFRNIAQIHLRAFGYSQIRLNRQLCVPLVRGVSKRKYVTVKKPSHEGDSERKCVTVTPETILLLFERVLF